MKKIVVSVCCLLATLSLFSQGYHFNNSIGPDGTKYFAHGTDINSGVTKVLPAQNGKSFLAINSAAGAQIVKLNADGTPDPSFSFNGIAGPLAGYSISDMALDPGSGNVVFVCGYSSNTFCMVGRVQPDGTLDPTFSNPYFAYGGNATSATSIDVYDDGSIIVGGENFQYGYSGFTHADFTKFLPSGALDLDFGTNGKVESVLGSLGAYISDVHFDENGNIIFCGTTSNLGGNNAAWNNLMAGRMLPNGSFDPAFNGTGYTVVNMSDDPSQEWDYGNTCGLQSDGKIVVGGKARYNNSVYVAIARFNTNGSLDNSFDGDGKLYLRNLEGNIFYDCSEIIVTPGNTLTRKIFLGCYGVVSGAYYDGFGVIALGANGAPFGWFNYGNNATAVTKFGSASQNDYPKSIALLSDGSLIEGGSTTGFTPDGSRYSLIKYEPNFGLPDPTFNQTGTLCAQLKGISGKLINFQEANGKITALENFGSQYFLSRYSTSAIPDVTFGNNGVSDISSLSSNTNLKCVESQNNGAAYVIGMDNTAKLKILHVLSNGTPDPSFGTGGTVQYNYLQPSLKQGRRLLSDGTLLVSVQNSPGASLLHINADGSEDAAFSANAGIINISGASNFFINNIQLQSGGQIICQLLYYLNGAFYGQLRRFSSNGTPDLSFGNSGVVDLGVILANSESLFVGTDDEIYFCALSSDNTRIIWKKFLANGLPFPGVGTGETDGTNAGAGYSILGDGSVYADPQFVYAGDGQIFYSVRKGATNFERNRIGTSGALCTNCVNPEVASVPASANGQNRYETGILALPDQSIVLGGYVSPGLFLSNQMKSFLQFIDPPPCQPIIITQQPLASQAICQDATPVTLTVAATGSIDNYEWFEVESGESVAVGLSFIPPVSTPGTHHYYCVLSSACGNVNSEQATVTVKPFHDLSVAVNHPDPILCAGQHHNFSADVLGAETTPQYQWFVNNVNQNVNSPMFDFTPVGGEQVSCTITVNEGCYYEGPTPVTLSSLAMVQPAFTADYTVLNLSACAGTPDGQIFVSPHGGSEGYVSYSWTGTIGSGNPSTTPFPDPGNVANISGLQYGFYNVTITDDGGCGSVTFNNIHVSKAFLPVITTGGSSSASCNASGSIIVYASAGVSPYKYQLDGGAILDDNIFQNVNAGSHMVTVIDFRGCTNTKIVTVGAAPALGFTSYVYKASSCNDDGAIRIYRSGGIPPFSYSVDGGAFVNTNYFSGLSAGIHSITIKDSKGCTATQSVTVDQGTGLNVTLNQASTSACVNDGSIQVNVSGGVGPYLFSLNEGPSQNSNNFSGLGAGNYVVKVLDARGCQGTANTAININNMVVTFYKSDAINCSGTGSIKLFITGGSGPYTYSIDGNTYQPENSFSNLPPGTYTGFVKDYKTCIGQTIEGVIIIGPENCNNNTRIGHPASLQQEAKTYVEAFPNPSISYFKLSLIGFRMNDKVSITVTDLLGRVVFQEEGIGRLQYEIGRNFLPGLYNVNVVQGLKKYNLKIVKE
ncbi:MAG: hypothetical protein IT254_06610 [Chitinophagaceae bacterium]|nr:hypothetical protein [Chitinophagaceae bacterium]